MTSMCWSSLYSDQFAVGYGSFHYQKQGTGAVSVFSLKNPSHAERTITTQSGEANRSSVVGTVLKQRAIVLQLPAQACSKRLLPQSCPAGACTSTLGHYRPAGCLLYPVYASGWLQQAAVKAAHLMSSASVSACCQV